MNSFTVMVVQETETRRNETCPESGRGGESKRCAEGGLGAKLEHRSASPSMVFTVTRSTGDCNEETMEKEPAARLLQPSAA